MTACTRCGKEAQTKTFMWHVRPGGHSIPSLAQPSLEAIAPTVEYVCAECITDDEIARQLDPVMAFVLGTMINTLAKQPESDWRNEQLKVLEIVRCQFIVMNLNPNNRDRNAALRAIGLQND